MLNRSFQALVTAARLFATSRVGVPAAALAVAAVLALPAISIHDSTSAAPLAQTSSGTAPAVGTTKSIVTLTVHNTKHNAVTSVAAGTTIHPSVAVTGSAGTPTGVVSFVRYGTSDCSGDLLAGAASGLVGGTLDFTGQTYKPMTPGTLSFKATYPGDATYLPAVSACTLLTVTKATPTVVSGMHDAGHHLVASVPANDPVHVSVVVSGNAATPTGTVEFIWYDGESCLGSTYLRYTRTLASGAVEAPSLRSYAGTFAVQVTYQGDGTYNSRVGPCMVITWVKLTPTIALGAHRPDHTIGTEFKIGTLVHPVVALSGPYATFGDSTVTLMRFPTANCTGTPDMTDVPYLGGASLDPTAVASTASQPARVSWQIAYQGDPNYLPGFSNCLVLSFKATAATKVTAHDAHHHAVTSVQVGGSVHGAVVASGSFGTPTGQVQILVYSGGACQGPSEYATVDLVGGKVDASSPALATSSVGTISLLAVYEGDGTYLDSGSSCIAVSVVKASATVTTTVHDANHAALYSVALGSTVHPRVQVTGAAGTPTGSVLVRWLGTSDCTGPSLVEPFMAVLSAGGVDVTSFAQTPAAPGSYGFGVIYGGNATYQNTSMSCQPFVILAPGQTPPPTPSPTPSPTPTLAPGATPTAAPSGVTPTPGAGETPGTGASASAGSSADQHGSGAASPTTAGATSSPAPGDPPATDAGQGGPTVLLLVFGLVIGAAVGAIVVGRSRRRITPPG